MGGIKAQTPREKRLQSRAERTENVQASEDTSKTTTPKLKDKAPLDEQAKIVKTVFIGSLKTVSTGRHKTVDTGLSTRSMETEEQKGEIAGNFS